MSTQPQTPEQQAFADIAKLAKELFEARDSGIGTKEFASKIFTICAPFLPRETKRYEVRNENLWISFESGLRLTKLPVSSIIETDSEAFRLYDVTFRELPKSPTGQEVFDRAWKIISDLYPNGFIPKNSLREVAAELGLTVKGDK